jgi:hypothetical protein
MLTPLETRNSSGNVPISCESREEMVITSWSSHECCARGYEVISLFIQASERHAARSTDGRTSLKCPTVIFGISSCGTGRAKGLDTGKLDVCEWQKHSGRPKVYSLLFILSNTGRGSQGAAAAGFGQNRSITLICREYRVGQGIPQGRQAPLSTSQLEIPRGTRRNHRNRKGRGKQFMLRSWPMILTLTGRR